MTTSAEKPNATGQQTWLAAAAGLCGALLGAGAALLGANMQVQSQQAEERRDDRREAYTAFIAAYGDWEGTWTVTDDSRSPGGEEVTSEEQTAILAALRAVGVQQGRIYIVGTANASDAALLLQQDAAAYSYKILEEGTLPRKPPLLKERLGSFAGAARADVAGDD